MRASINITSLIAALVCGAVSVSPACAQTPVVSSAFDQTQDAGVQKVGTDLLFGALGLSLLTDLFHSGSSSHSSPFSSGSNGGGVGGNGLPQRGGPVPNPSPVPETSTSASLGVMLLLGAGGLVVVSRRRRLKTAS